MYRDGRPSRSERNETTQGLDSSVELLTVIAMGVAAALAIFSGVIDTLPIAGGTVTQNDGTEKPALVINPTSQGSPTCECPDGKLMVAIPSIGSPPLLWISL